MLYSMNCLMSVLLLISIKPFSSSPMYNKCELACFNGGTCISFKQNGEIKSMCMCSKDFSGEQCNITSISNKVLKRVKRVKREPIECDYICYNGGTCEIRNIDNKYHFSCLCVQGFSGEQCRDSNILDEREPQFKRINSDEISNEIETQVDKRNSYLYAYVVWTSSFAAFIIITVVVLFTIYKCFPKTAHQTKSYIQRQTSVKDKK